MNQKKYLLLLLLLLNLSLSKAQDINYNEINNYKINTHLFGIGFMDTLFKLSTIYQIDFSINDLNTLNQGRLFNSDNQITLNYIQHFVLLKRNHFIVSNQSSFNTLFTNNEQFKSYVFNVGLRFTAGLYFNKYFVAIPFQFVNYFPHYIDFKSESYQSLHGAENNGWQKRASSTYNYGLLFGITPSKRWDLIFEIKRHSKLNTRQNSDINEYRLQFNYRFKPKEKKE